MDYNEKNRLTDENQKWLDDLLNTPDSQEVGASQLAKQFAKPEEEPKKISPEERAIQEAEALVADQKIVIDVGDEELEKILAEDWLQITPDDFQEAPVEEPAVLEKTQVVKTPTEATEPSLPKPKKSIEQKGRPKRTDGYGLWGIPHIFATVIWIALILAIGISLGRVLWVCCADMMAFGKEPQTVTITITEDDTVESISKKLSNASLIRYPKLFALFVNITGKYDDIGTGTFTLNSQLDYNAMVNAMYSYGASRDVVDIMFPEGYNCAQIFKLLEDKNVCTAAELEEYAANGELKEYWFLEGVARGDKYCLEGYMAPDTYSFYTNDSPRRVIEKFLNEFDDRFTDKMKEDFITIQQQYANRLKAKGYSAAYITEHTLTLHQVVTLASIVQRETSSDSECYDIASVFYNRLVNPNIQSLGADATVYYALGDYFGEIDKLTAEHLDVDSPYNTRKNRGIPPGPICNMGVQALYATLEPNETDYQYFVYDRNKYAHRFAVTQWEHQQNVAELMG